MRAAGLCASIFAVAQLVVVTPAFAGTQNDPNAPAADTKPAKPSKKATKKPKKKKGDKKTETVDPTPPPAPTPPPDPAPVSTTTVSSATVPAADPTPPAPPPAPEPPQPAVEEKPTEVADGMVDVHIESPTAVRLQKHNGGSSWETVCTSPCDTKVAVTPQYRVAGIGLNDSEPFTLDASKGHVNLKVDPGSKSAQQRGVWTLIGSGAVLAGGAAVIVLAGRKGMDAQNQLPQSSTNAILIGSSMMLAGVIGGLVGGSWYVQNARTGVAGDVGHVTREKGEAKAPTKKAAENDRQPTWNTPTMPGTPAATTVPFLSGTF